MERKFSSFTFTLDDSPESNKGEQGNEFAAVLLVGDGTYNGLFVPAPELAKAAPTMDRQPVNIDHSDRLEDEVGYVRDARMDPDGKTLRGVLILNPNTAKFLAAKSYILNRRAAGKPPEVSVGFFFTLDESADGSMLIVRDIEFDHLALVTRGACSPQNGCGVGMSASCAHGVSYRAACAKCERVLTNAPGCPHTTSDGSGTCRVIEEVTMANNSPEAKLAPVEEAPATPAAPAEPEKAAEQAPCGCKELEAALIVAKQVNDKLTKDNERLTLALAEAPERFALKAEAEVLGAAVADSDSLAAVREKVALAKQVRAHLGAQAGNGQRHTAPVVNGKDANSADAQARKLLRLAGVFTE